MHLHKNVGGEKVYFPSYIFNIYINYKLPFYATKKENAETVINTGKGIHFQVGSSRELL